MTTDLFRSEAGHQADDDAADHRYGHGPERQIITDQMDGIEGQAL
jgi:hypothetical protein